MEESKQPPNKKLKQD